MRQDDETAIREFVATWMDATRAGDTETVLGLMTDDVVFLVTGRPPFGKREFEAAANAQAATPVRFDGTSEIEEIRVMGDWAFLRSRLTVTATQPGQPPVMRSGYTMSVLVRRDERWLLARDANLLAPADAAAGAGKVG
jgi:uncharacterized protein (TIGR02246 family)